jgi:hypothetical protein
MVADVGQGTVDERGDGIHDEEIQRALQDRWD